MDRDWYRAEVAQRERRLRRGRWGIPAQINPLKVEVLAPVAIAIAAVVFLALQYWR